MAQEIVSQENFEEVKTLSEISENKLSQQEKFVRDVLKDYEFYREYVDPETWETKTQIMKSDPESMLKQIFDDANSVITQNNKWDIIPDYKARAQLKIKLLESMGIIKPKQPEVKINFLSMLFGRTE